MKTQTILHKVGNIIITLYFLLLVIILPLYNKGSYSKIGDIKYELFKNIGIVITLVMILITALSLILKHFREHLLITDIFMCGYFISVFVSYIFTSFAEEAFWGVNGWYMGFVSQMLFIGIYFLFSRYFIWNNKWLYIIFISSGLIFLLGILDSYSIYLISMIGRTPGFISTIGNINWFCGYWAVICPFGIMFYWLSDTKWKQTIAGIYVIICFIAGIIQGSNSAYLVFAGGFIFIFSLSFKENLKLYRFLQLCMLFLLSCQMIKLLCCFPVFILNYDNELNNLIIETNLTLYTGIAFIITYLIFHYKVKNGYDIKQHKRIRNSILILITVILIVYVILLITNTCCKNKFFGLSEISFFTFNDKWASSRGATWRIGIEAYKNMPLSKKLIGIGPDCFTYYVCSIEKLANDMYTLFDDAILTNAHNEWITILVNYGIIGLICFAGIFISAFIRFIKRVHFQYALYFCTASILLYTVHNIVSFQQILNTPFAFMILGIGEGLCRKQK